MFPSTVKRTRAVWFARLTLASHKPLSSFLTMGTPSGQPICIVLDLAANQVFVRALERSQPFAHGLIASFGAEEAGFQCWVVPVHGSVPKKVLHSSLGCLLLP